ncbi:DUF3817 domain-containing protein [Bizionia gelidisalsuginis]|uniref:DUF3817 domain-containing protein n=2 Tax=Bizionia TaxID=283785 RepID=A0A8H2LDR9_9FLAO|nr:MULTISPECIES: DUF3817 domain-containing protein [Bizionia]TYB76711.1 DUF3817 domain-containing protein [Bizionia saleffrena]TYC14092.1 DUF3817 domain-containing protein [Bizionia gelidisalsuginis]
MLSTFRIIALLEGLSYILLLFIATPLKYFAEDPQYVKLLGMPHGLLFVAYVALAIFLRSKYKWNNTSFFIILLCSLLPFGTFYADVKYFKPLAH